MKNTRTEVRPSWNKLLLAALVGLCWLGLTGPARADVNWKIGTNNTWESSASWNEGHPPSPADSLDWIKQGGTYTVSVTDTTADTGSTNTWLNNGWVLLGSGTGLATISINFTNTTAVWKTGNFTVGRTDGDNGKGQLIISNGTVNVTGTLALSDGVSNTGTVFLVGGKLSAAGMSVAQSTGNSRGIFNMSGGTANLPSLGAGGNAGGYGTINLSGGFMASTNGTLGGSTTIGGFGRGEFNITGGNYLGDLLVIGQDSPGTGTLTMSAGTSVTIQNQMWLGGYLSHTGGNGQFIMNGGSVSMGAGHNTYIGLNATSSGTLTINNGTYDSSGATVYIGYVGTGTVNSVGGNFSAAGMNVGFTGASVGRWNITGGTNQVANMAIGTVAATDDGGVVLSGGGVLEIGSSLAMGNGANTPFLTNSNGGTLRFTATNPTITLNNAGSKVVVTNAAVEFKDVNGADVSATGNITTKITYLGGNNTLRLNNSTNALLASAVFSSSTNFATLAMVNGNTRWNSGFLTTGSGGSVVLTNTQASFSGVFTNQGTFSSYHSSATFAGKVVNSGAWITDPSTNTFLGDYSLTSTGYVQMAAGDVYTFKSNFINQSTQSNTYDTVAGKFLFNGTSVTQSFFTAGKDLGPEAGYTPGRTNNILPGTVFGTGPGANNFALGTLEISNSSTVKVSDAFSVTLSNDDGQRAALYLDQLILDQNSWLIIDTNVTVYFRGSNDWAAANAGVSMLFDGELHQLVPEPSVLLLWASGLGLLGYLRRRSVRK